MRIALVGSILAMLFSGAAATHANDHAMSEFRVAGQN